jgi:pimeloyl-ACP methyl ester carboxylesterase
MNRGCWGFVLVTGLLWSGCTGGPFTREELRELRRYESLPPGAQSKFVEVRGKRIHYLEQSDGDYPAILLLHGFPTSSYTWRHVIPRLAKRYRVYALDLIGYGQSTVPPSVNRSLGAQVSYVAEWMEAIGLRDAIVAGQDIGGGVAQLLAVKYPSKARGLVLINSVCFDSWPYEYANLLKEPGYGQFVGAGLTRRTGFKAQLMKGVYHQKLLSDGVVDSYYEPWNSENGRRNLLANAQDQDNRDTTGIENDLRAIRAPTLVIAGRFDPFQPTDYSRRLAGSIPGAQFTIIPDCGHIATEDEPEKIVKYIFDFFR